MIFGPSENPLNLEDKFPVQIIKNTFVHEYCIEIVQCKNKPSVSPLSLLVSSPSSVTPSFSSSRGPSLLILARTLLDELFPLKRLKRRDNFVI